MKFALQDKLLGNEKYQDIFAAAKELGFEGVEIVHFEGPLNLEVTNEIIKASQKTSVQPSAVCGGYKHWIGDFDTERRLEAVKGIITSLVYVQGMGAQGLIAPAAYGIFSRRLPPFHPPRDEARDKEALLDSLQRIAAAAEKTGTQLLLEPLNRYEDHMLNTVGQAAELIRLTGSSHVKVMADFFHMNIEEDDIVATINQYHSYIGYFHLADSQRQQPGTGHTNFSVPFQKLRQLEYQGYLSLECGITGERKLSLKNTVEYLQNCTK